MMVFRTTYGIFICILLLIGCVTFMESKQTELFALSSNAYEQALLRGKYEAARGFIREELSEMAERSLNTFKKIKVTSYEPLSIKGEKDTSLVNQTVDIRYYFIDSLIERSVIDHQIWKYYAEEKTWYLESGLPDFK